MFFFRVKVRYGLNSAKSGLNLIGMIGLESLNKGKIALVLDQNFPELELLEKWGLASKKKKKKT